MLLSRLLDGGVSVSVENGHLKLISAAGACFDESSLRPLRKQLMEDIARVLAIPCYRYSGYKAGLTCGHSTGRLAVYFVNVITAESVVVYYNVETKRSRSIGNNKAGNMLPKGRFIVGERSRFYQFWCSTELGMPRYNSEFHKVINRLKKLIFCGETEIRARGADAEVRFRNKLVPRLTLSAAQLRVVVKEWETSGRTVGSLWENRGKNMGEDISHSPRNPRAGADFEPRVVCSAGKDSCVKGGEQRGSERFHADMDQIARELIAEHKSEDPWLLDYAGE